jgi:hypothetical protein
VVSPGDWFVSSIWLLLATGQVAIGGWGNLLSVHAVWSELLFSPGCSCSTLELKLCFVCSSPSKAGVHFSFWLLPSVPQDQLQDLPLPCFGRLVWHPTHALSLCALPRVSASFYPVEGWLVTPHPLSVFVASSFTERLAPRVWLLAPSPFSKADSVLCPHLCCWCEITIHCFCFSVLFFLGGFNLPSGCTGLCSLGMGRGVAYGLWCSPVHSVESRKHN